MTNGSGGGMLPELQILISPTLLSSVTHGPIWQYIGPGTRWRGIAERSYQAGAMNQVSVDPQDRNTIYASSYDGGLWRLPNVLNYPRVPWQPLTDTRNNTTLRTCCFAIAPSDNQVLYLADGLGRVGRSGNRGNSWEFPNSILERYDGRRWRSVAGSNRFNYISKILVDRRNSDIVYVASDQPGAGGAGVWSINGQPGFWKSTNRGVNWKEIHPGQISDAAMDSDPGTSSIIYIGVRGQGLFKTPNANGRSFGWGDWPRPRHC